MSRFLLVSTLLFFTTVPPEIRMDAEPQTVQLSEVGFTAPPDSLELTEDDDWEEWVVPEGEIDTTVLPSSRMNTLSYPQTLAAIKRDRLKRNGLVSTRKDSVVQEAGQALEQVLTRDIFPYWYGTEWDFNGITSKPGEGLIACGYFVSTTTKQVGFHLNRYRVAQRGAAEIAATYGGDSLVVTIRELEKLWDYVESQPDGLYVLGLSFHVGFLHKAGDHIWFIHANYGGPAKVIREKAKKSPALHSSDVFVLSPPFHHPVVVEKWLSGEFIAPPPKS